PHSLHHVALLLPPLHHSTTVPILYARRQHPLLGFVDLLHSNHLDLARDSAPGAEIEHLLRFRDSPDQRADKAPASPDERHYTNRLGFRRDAYQSQRPVTFQ